MASSSSSISSTTMSAVSTTTAAASAVDATASAAANVVSTVLTEAQQIQNYVEKGSKSLRLLEKKNAKNPDKLRLIQAARAVLHEKHAKSTGQVIGAGTAAAGSASAEDGKTPSSASAASAKSDDSKTAKSKNSKKDDAVLAMYPKPNNLDDIPAMKHALSSAQIDQFIKAIEPHKTVANAKEALELALDKTNTDAALIKLRNEATTIREFYIAREACIQRKPYKVEDAMSRVMFAQFLKVDAGNCFADLWGKVIEHYCAMTKSQLSKQKIVFPDTYLSASLDIARERKSKH